MKRLGKAFSEHWQQLGLWLLGLAVLAGLFLYRLGSLVGGLSSREMLSASAPVGWHGIYHQPLYLPLLAVRSVVFALSPDHGQSLTRLPNALFGIVTVVVFGLLIHRWHGRRTTILTTALFACAAWTLHISRYASFDVMYLVALPALLYAYVLWQKNDQKALYYYGSLLLWGITLYIPGMLWFVIFLIWWQRYELLAGWQKWSKLWQRALAILAFLIWLPLLIIDLLRSSQTVQTWLGLPLHWVTVPNLAKQFVAVPIHLFIRGPEYPAIWLGRLPILDIGCLVLCVLGIYFYARHYKAGRSQLLGMLFFIGWILVALGGPVGLSLLVPLLFVFISSGISYLLHDWLKVFPTNPLARTLGIGLVAIVVIASCTYNLRAYFVAWPHAPTTHAIFRYHR